MGSNLFHLFGSVPPVPIHPFSSLPGGVDGQPGTPESSHVSRIVVSFDTSTSESGTLLSFDLDSINMTLTADPLPATAVVASCVHCIGTGQLLLPRMAQYFIRGRQSVSYVGNASGSYPLDQPLPQGFSIRIFGEFPLLALLEQGAEAFVQFGNDSRSRTPAFVVDSKTGSPAQAGDATATLESIRIAQESELGLPVPSSTELQNSAFIPITHRYSLEAPVP